MGTYIFRYVLANAEGNFLCFQKRISMCAYKIFMEESEVNVEQWRAFPVCAVIWASFICNV
jgi:hypothetical protein